MARSERPTLLGIVGSIRTGSYNGAILTALSEAVVDRASLKIFSLRDVPLYDQDLDTTSPPESVAALRSAIGSADGIVIGSPEYNYGLSGVLKNALDWASRPYGKSTLTGKPVLTFTASPAFTGGARAQAQLNEVLLAIAAQPVLRPQAVIPSVHQKIVDGRFSDQAALDFLKTGIDDLLHEIRRKAALPVRQET